MASAKFLEEALSTDVDESAVNAIVGSLENQLVTSTPPISTHQVNSASVINQNHQLQNSAISNGGTIISAVQKHGVANGGSATSMNNIIQSQDNSSSTKSITTTTLLPVNVVTSNTIVHTTTQQHQQQQQQQQHQQHSQTGIPSAAYINQVTTNQQTNITKNQEQPVKLIYPSTGVVNVNNRLSFPTQTVGHLPNGSLGVTTQTVLQTTSGLAHNIGSITQTNSQSVSSSVSTNVNKQQGGTALVIKTSGAPGGMVSVPMSVPVSVAGNAASTTMQGKAGVTTSTIVPSNVQILNVNTMRPGTPVAGQQTGKPVASRVVIGSHMVGARPGAPGITLQALQGLQPGTQGHLLLKTENGQYQLLRVGPAPTAGTPGGGNVTQNSIAGGGVVAPTGGTTFRLASVPAVSRLNTQFTGPPLATLRKPVQTVAASVTTATSTAGTVTTVAAATPVPAAAKVQTGQNPAQRQTTDNTKEKCRKFLANLLELSSREPKSVERNVRTLIQELIDTKVEPEEFCDRLERLLNASPQPCLIGFLKKSLPLLRQSLVTKDLVIEGIRPPPANVVFSIADNTQLAQVQQNQLRPTVAVAGTGHSVGGIATTQVRVMAPLAGTTTMVQRPAQPIQQRLIRPVVTMVRSPTAHTVKTTVAVSGIRPTVPTIQKPQVTNVMKTAANTVQGKTVNANTTLNKAVVPSLVPKPTAKEKEKKTFSSAGYTGDDDINDVAAMGGVNLAEESQRILGSTEFVGTQIRSCKDEVFLHMTPLQQRIKQIVSSYGLEEPNAEVASLISHATQERLKNLVEKLAVIAEHRIDLIKVDPRYEVTQDVRAQLKFLEELDRVERRRHEEQERELLLRAAKSRAKTEDPEQAKLKAKAKEMQRAEMEELRQREANLTALQAIGPRKKPKLDVGGSASGTGSGAGLNSSSSGLNRQMPMRPRLKRVNYRDLLFLLEQEKETCRSTTLYKSYLK